MENGAASSGQVRREGGVKEGLVERYYLLGGGGGGGGVVVVVVVVVMVCVCVWCEAQQVN